MNRRKGRLATVRRTLRNFFRTTTLHGFKYLCSEFDLDRIGWVLCCFASTCCAGVLCAVLWTRFLQVPAVLELRDVLNITLTQHMPEIAVCPPALDLTGFFCKQLNMNATMNVRLLKTVEDVLAGKPAAQEQVQLLEELLTAQNMTLPEMILKYSPACDELTVSCRWQNTMVPCGALFEKVLTSWGMCCIMRPEKAHLRLLNESIRINSRFDQVRTLDLSLKCSNHTTRACKFFAKYEEELNVESMLLVPGYIYFATIFFTSVPMSSVDFLESNCGSYKNCLDKCAEIFCGCSEFFHDIDTKEVEGLPSCSISQLACLRAYRYQSNITCECLPSCNKISSSISMESTNMNLDTFIIDPIYNELNSKSTVLYFQLNIPHSKFFTLKPTETWFTLLSSLGGIFNMFLGVGLFSAIEILILILVKMPIAFRNSLFH